MELALVLPLLVLLIFGALEFGRVFNAWVVVTQAAREGARVASVQCTLDAACNSSVQDRIDASVGDVDPLTLRSTLSAGPYVSGDAVTVRVERDVQIVVPFLNTFFPGGVVTVTGETTMRLE